MHTKYFCLVVYHEDFSSVKQMPWFHTKANCFKMYNKIHSIPQLDEKQKAIGVC